MGAAWPHKSDQGSRRRGGQKTLTMPLPPAKDVRAAAGASPRPLAVGRKWGPGAQGPASLTGAKRTRSCTCWLRILFRDFPHAAWVVSISQ